MHVSFILKWPDGCYLLRLINIWQYFILAIQTLVKGSLRTVNFFGTTQFLNSELPDNQRYNPYDLADAGLFNEWPFTYNFNVTVVIN